jgi:hypothetical protein
MDGNFHRKCQKMPRQKFGLLGSMAACDQLKKLAPYLTKELAPKVV